MSIPAVRNVVGICVALCVVANSGDRFAWGEVEGVTIEGVTIEGVTIEGVTIKGRMSQNNNERMQIDFLKFPVTLTEVIADQLPMPELPKDWDAMLPDDRRAWFAEFESSQAGKELLAKRAQIIKDANQFDVVLEESGQFVVYDVPPGIYELRGRKDQKVGLYDYAFEVFGQVVVSPNVDEILLDPIRVLATPLLSRGQPMPKLKMEIFADGKVVDPAMLKGKPIFLSFWSSEFSRPSVEFQTQVQEMFTELSPKYDLLLLSISLDQSRKRAAGVIKENGLAGYHGFASGWEHPAVEAFGVRALPFFILIDGDQKILMNHAEIRQAFAMGKSISQLIAEQLSGKSEAAPVTGGGKSSR